MQFPFPVPRRGRAARWTGGLVAVATTCGAAASNSGHPIADARTLQLSPGLEVSLFAREPDVVDPVALTFDAVGDAYVVEMRDYPYGIGAERKPGGTIRRLRDADGDGRVDQSTLFAEGLSFPTSVTPWNGGILVTAPPDVIFLRDADGDGRADVREVVLTGFRLSVTDSNANGLRWGLDNRVHIANGGNGGQIRSPAHPGAEPVRLGDRDLRWDPATGRFELTSDTGGGFGLVFDDWGRSFVPYNINHLQQRVAHSDAFAVLAGYPPFSTTHSISDHGDMARIFPISEAQTRPNHPEQAGHFSAAGGMGYLGHLDWPGDLPGSVFVGDVVGNLFHRDLLVPQGAIFRATRAPSEQDREFLASRDPAFRPVGLEPGPDGALYLLDMQRDVIEHPDYIPARMLATLDARAGDDRGRLYRIAPKGWPKARDLPGHADVSGLVAFLDSPNPWTRGTAQRLLVERRATNAIDRLRAKARVSAPWSGSVAAALGRLHALWTLDGLGALDEATLLGALDDPHPGVRENAAVLAGQGSPTRASASPELRRQLAKRSQDDSPMVRFRAVLALGERADIPTLARVLSRDRGDAWMRRAALAGGARRLDVLLDELLRDSTLGRDATGVTLLRELGAVAGGTDAATQVLGRALGDGVMPPLRVALLDGLAEGVERTGRSPAPAPESTRRALATLESDADRAMLAALWRIARHWPTGAGTSATRERVLTDAARDALDPHLGLEHRLDAARLLALGDFRHTGPTLLALLSGVHPAALQEAAFGALRSARGHEAEVGPGLVKAWPALAPGLRAAVVNAFVYVAGLRPALLDALESGALQVGELNLDLEHRRQLLRKSAPAIRERAAKFMSDEEYSNRKAVVDQWLARLPSGGDAGRGRAVFERLCAQCHRSGGLGFDVGPELTGMSHRSVEDLLSNILDPNMAMNPAFVAYTAELKDGESETGILVGDTAAAVVLAQAGGRRVELPRDRIRELRSGGKSLMPEGLEAGLTPQDLRDLVALLQAPAPAPGKAP